MDNERRWTCAQCGSLLAVDRAGRLHVKLGRLHYVVDGPEFRVTAVCRHCAGVTEFIRETASPASARQLHSPETLDVQPAKEAHRRPAREVERNDRPVDA